MGRAEPSRGGGSMAIVRRTAALKAQRSERVRRG